MASSKPLQLYCLLLLVGVAALWAGFTTGTQEPKYRYEAERLSFEDSVLETTDPVSGTVGEIGVGDFLRNHDNVYYCDRGVETPACILLTQTAPDNGTRLTAESPDSRPLQTRAFLRSQYVYEDGEFYYISRESARGPYENITLEKRSASETLRRLANEDVSEAHLTALREGTVVTSRPIAHEDELLYHDGTLFWVHEDTDDLDSDDTSTRLWKLEIIILGGLGWIATYVGGGGLLGYIWERYHDSVR